MKRDFTTAMLIAALLLPASSIYANVGSASGKTAPAKQSEAAANNPKAKAAGKVKLIDINSASKAELKTLPGIRDAEADKIVAGRPYGSKAFLVTRNIIPAGIYEQIKRQIIARQK